MPIRVFRLLALFGIVLELGACAGVPWRGGSPPACPAPPPCPSCEAPVCPVVEPVIIETEKEKIVTRTIEVPVPRPEDALALFGQTEMVYVEAAGMTLEARIDTGSASCAINATDVTPFERDGKKYVRFTIPGVGDKPAKTLELRQKSRVKINRQDPGKKPVRRYIVRMWLQIDKVRERVAVSLAGSLESGLPDFDRAQFSH